MYSKISFLALLGIVASAAGQVTLSLTLQTVSDWTIVGADASAISSQSKVALPPGAQLARSFSGSAIVVKFTSLPAVGENAADWPVLEVGPDALIFARGISGGKLVLVSGDSAPTDLPFTFALDAEGVSTTPITISFSRTESNVTVAMGGRSLQFEASGPVNAATDVVLSAGGARLWRVQSLDVISDGGSASSPFAAATTKSESVPTQPMIVTVVAAVASGQAKAKSGNAAGVASNTTGEQPSKTAVSASRPEVSLEVFTPPAVRPSRAAAVRDLVNRLSK